MKQTNEKDKIAELNYVAKMNRMIKSLDKKYKKKKGPVDAVKFLVSLIVGAVLFILVCNFIINGYIYMQAKEWKEGLRQDAEGEQVITILTDQAFQSNLLNVGLSIIGIAITIWAGLNIIQVIEKSEVAKIANQVRQFETERKAIYKKQFLGELKSQNRVILQYFYVRFVRLDEISDDIPASIYYRLLRLEMAYKNIYSKQVREIRNFEKDSLYDFMRDIMEILDLVKSERISLKTAQLVEEFVRTRKAEFCFNLGYDDNTPIENAVQYFENAISEYMSLYSIEICKRINGDMIDISPNLYTENLKNELCHIVDGDISERYAIHILNTIAEAHSKIAYKFLRIEDAVKQDDQIKRKSQIGNHLDIAINIFKGIIDIWGDKLLLQEFIYRNYGAALERRWKKEKGKDYGGICDYYMLIKKQYDISMEKALSQNSFREGVFSAWGALYFRGVKTDVLKTLFPDGIYEGRTLNLDDMNNIKKWTDEACSYMEIAIHMYPTNSKYVKLYGIARSFKCIFFIREGKIKSAEYELEYAMHIYEKAHMIDAKKEPDNYLELLESVWSAAEQSVLSKAIPACQYIKYKK